MYKNCVEALDHLYRSVSGAVFSLLWWCVELNFLLPTSCKKGLKAFKIWRPAVLKPHPQHKK